MLKSDNERAILALLRTTLSALRVDHLESPQEAHPAAYDSSSNATTESACKVVAGQIRIQNTPVKHCVFDWIVEHAAWLLTIRTTQSDGITPYKRLRGKNFRIPMLGFGEFCLHKINRKQPTQKFDGKMSPRWREGIFLGFSRDSNEFVLWDMHSKKICRARSVQRVKESERWKPDLLVQVNQKPQDALYRAAAVPTVRSAGDAEFEHRVAPEDEEPKTRATSIRDLRVTQEDLERFGTTPMGCQRCDFYETNKHTRGCSFAHSKQCRDRIKAELGKSEEGRERLRKVEERLARRRRPKKEDATSKAAGSEPRLIPGEARSEPPISHGATGEEKGDDDDDLLEDVEDAAMSPADDTGSYAPPSPASGNVLVESPTEESSPGGSMASVVERDTPMERLFALSQDIFGEAVKTKASQPRSDDELKSEFMKEERCSKMIYSLPHSARTELVEEMVGLCREAEHLGAPPARQVDALAKEANTIVSEVYSPPRVTKAARILKRLGITPVFAMDITVNDEDGNPWDFENEAQQAKAHKRLIDTEPDLLVGSPECKEYSPWQRINKAKSSTPEEYEERQKKADRHLEFVCNLYRSQCLAGRLFLHEHPRQASSWD